MLSVSRFQRHLQREQSAVSETPSKRSVVWDALWAVDFSVEGGKKAAK